MTKIKSLFFFQQYTNDYYVSTEICMSGSFLIQQSISNRSTTTEFASVVKTDTRFERMRPNPHRHKVEEPLGSTAQWSPHRLSPLVITDPSVFIGGVAGRRRLSSLPPPGDRRHRSGSQAAASSSSSGARRRSGTENEESPVK